jgi:hypothetical protein
MVSSIFRGLINEGVYIATMYGVILLWLVDCSSGAGCDGRRRRELLRKFIVLIFFPAISRSYEGLLDWTVRSVYQGSE